MALPIRPYDMATDTMFEYMGVRVDPVDELGEVAMEKLAGPDRAGGKSDARPATATRWMAASTIASAR